MKDIIPQIVQENLAFFQKENNLRDEFIEEPTLVYSSTLNNKKPIAVIDSSGVMFEVDRHGKVGDMVKEVEELVLHEAAIERWFPLEGFSPNDIAKLPEGNGKVLVLRALPIILDIPQEEEENKRQELQGFLDKQKDKKE